MSNKPVQLAQFCKSWGADATRYSDPFMSIVPAVSQYVGNYVFTTVTSLFDTDPFSHYLSLMILTQYVEGIRLDGANINTESFVVEWTAIGRTVFSYATVALAPGRHHLYHRVSSVTFGAQLYGIKLQEAYAHPLGQKLEAIDNLCIIAEMAQKDYFDNDCDGRYDEEILNGLDDDADGLIDEDVYDQHSARPYNPEDLYQVIKGGGEVFDEMESAATTEQEGTSEQAKAATTERNTRNRASTQLHPFLTDTDWETTTVTSALPLKTVTATQHVTPDETSETDKVSAVKMEESAVSSVTASKPTTNSWKVTTVGSVILSTLLASATGADSTVSQAKETVTPTLFSILNGTDETNDTSDFPPSTETENTTGAGVDTTVLEVDSTAANEIPENDDGYNIFRENPLMVILPFVIVLGIPLLYCLYHVVKALLGDKISKKKKNKVGPINRLEQQVHQDQNKRPAYVPASQRQAMNVDLRP